MTSWEKGSPSSIFCAQWKTPEATSHSLGKNMDKFGNLLRETERLKLKPPNGRWTYRIRQFLQWECDIKDLILQKYWYILRLFCHLFCRIVTSHRYPQANSDVQTFVISCFFPKSHLHLMETCLGCITFHIDHQTMVCWLMAIFVGSPVFLILLMEEILHHLGCIKPCR